MRRPSIVLPPCRLLWAAAACSGLLGTGARADGPATFDPVGATRAASATAALRTYAEALAQIGRRAAFVRDGTDPADLMAATLKAYLAREDAASDFLTPAELVRLRQAQSPGAAGIGMQIERLPDGAVACLPLPGGPAARSGVRAGDRLVSIGGVPAVGRALPTLAAAAAGKAGTTLGIEIEQPGGRRRSLSIVRAPLQPHTAVTERHGAMPVIRLVGFAPGTRRELAELLSARAPGAPLVLDLRGNAGGDLHAAFDAASLFLARGAPIASVRARDGIHGYASTTDPLAALDGQRAVLWQDGATASAAEVFIAALTGNARAVSVGARSFGKGTRQDLIELSDGSALVLTTGHLRTPAGVEFDGRGLAPGHAVDGESLAAYIDLTRRIAGRP